MLFLRHLFSLQFWEQIALLLLKLINYLFDQKPINDDHLGQVMNHDT